MTSDYEKDGVRDLLDTTKNYERLSFLKGIAGLYYRAALAFAIGLFGLIILEGLNSGQVFYDKGIFGSASEFTITQVGIIIVVITFLGDISFAFTRFITDQRYTEYLSRDDRAEIVKKFSLGSVLGGVLFAVPTILLATFGQIGEAQAWAIVGIFLGGLFLLLAKSSGHSPTYIIGSIVMIASILMAFEPIPGPYWMIMMMVFMAANFITAITSYFYAQHQF